MAQETDQKNTFLQRLHDGPILADGAIGTELYRRGNFPSGICFEELSVSHPDMVRQVHLDYIEAGAEIIETNTFGANRIKLERHGIENVQEINERAVALAHEARNLTGQEVWIAGAIGPLGKPLSPLGTIEPEQAQEVFREQVQALLEGGVDLILLETFPSLQEICEAITAVQSISDIPIVAQLTFTEDDHTPSGDSPEDVLDALQSYDLAALGANCSGGSESMLRIVEALGPNLRVPLSVMPNAGFPSSVDDRVAYASSPAYMADYTGQMLDHGATIVGGCCGTTPDHLAAMRSALNRHSGGTKLQSSRSLTRADRKRRSSTQKVVEPTNLAKKMGNEFVVTMEVHPPRGFDVGANMQDLRKLLSTTPIDAFNATDVPLAQARLSALAMSTLIQTRLGSEAIFHMGTRYRSLLAIQSDLLGAHALGVRNVAVFMGDPPSMGDYPMSTSISDVTSSGLIRLIKQANTGLDLSDRPIDQPTSFFVGCALNLEASDMAKELESLERKVQAGADFIWTQAVFDPEAVERCYQELNGFPLPLVLGVLPLRSFRHAEFLHNEVPGIVIPEQMRKRMKDAQDQGPAMGVALAQELLQASYEKIAGTYLIPAFGRYNAIAEIVASLPSKNP
jgi:homocysteine S-methyltransferase